MLFNPSALLTIDPVEILASNHYELPGRHFLTFSLLPDDFDPFDYRDWETDRKSTRLNYSH